MEPKFEILEHPSDVGIQAYGISEEEMFRNSVKALTSIIAGGSIISPKSERPVSITAIDQENLMVKWLNEVIFLFDTERFLTADVKILFICDKSLKANLLGEIADEHRHELNIDVKAVTYHQLKIQYKDGIWQARVFLDI